MRTPTSIRIEVTHLDGTVETAERDGLLGEYLICRQTIHQIASEQNFTIDDPRVARRHCSLVWDGSSDWLLRDLGSSSGTNVDGQPVLEEMVVSNGTQVCVGDSILQLQFGPSNDRNWRRPHASHLRSEVSENSLKLQTIGEDGGARQNSSQTGKDDETVVNVSSVIDAANKTPDKNADITLVNSRSKSNPGKTNIEGPAPRKTATDDVTLLNSAPMHDGFNFKNDATKIQEPNIPTMPTIVSFEPKTSSVTDDNGNREAGEVVKSNQSVTGREGYSDTMLQEMVLAGLLNAQQATSIENEARVAGRTVFSVIVNDVNLSNQSEIQEWGAARAGCRRITASQELQTVVRMEDWLPLKLAEDASVILLETEEEAIGEYATTDPFDVLTRDWVARCTNQSSIRPVLVSPPVFDEVLKRLRRDLNEDEKGEIGIIVDIDWESAERIRENLEDYDVPIIVDFILFRAHALGASDIHVEPTEQNLLIRNRVDGILHDEAVMPAELHPEVASRIKILSGMDVAEKRRPQDGRVSINIHQNPIDVRVSTFPTVYGEKIVMRLLDQSSLMPSPEHLGLRPHELGMLIDELNAPYGLIMLCGPTGSGKTTTLYSCLGSVDKSSKNVLTVEDPVEYRLEGVHQMQVNHKIGLTFAQGLRNILRQDPDIIMVGECRDLETAEMAIQASLTGHIVFSTIHTNDAIGVVSRLLDMQIDPFLVASAMTLAIAQRLVRTICPECKIQIDGGEVLKQLETDGVSDAKLELLGVEIDPDLQYAIGRGRGCSHCRGTGYLGRQAVFEVFQMTNEYRQIVMADNYNADQLRKLAAQDGMRTLVQSGLDLVQQGETTHQEVIRVLGGGH